MKYVHFQESSGGGYRPSLTIALSEIKMLPALTSRWIRRRPCRYSRPCRASVHMTPISSSWSGFLCTGKQHRPVVQNDNSHDGTANRTTLQCNHCKWTAGLLNHTLISGALVARCASGCVVECQICNREVACSNLGLGYFAPRSTQPSIPPGLVNEYQLRLGRQRQVWLIPIADWHVGVQVKLWNPLRTRAIPERFCGGDSLQRGAISSVPVCTLTFTFTVSTCQEGYPAICSKMPDNTSIYFVWN